MTVALRVLAMGEEALRQDEMQIVFRPRHGDVEKAPLLLDFRGRSGAEIGRNAAIDDVEHETPISIPVPWRNGWWRGSDSPRPEAARRPDRLWRPAGRASARSGSARGTDSRPRSVRAAEGRPAGSKASSWMRSRCGSYQRRACAISAGHPASPARSAQQGLHETHPVGAGARRRRHCRRARQIGSGRSAIRSSARCAEVGPTPGSSCMRRKPATRSRGFCAKRSSASMSLTWALSRNLRPPNLTKGMLRRVSSTSSGPL